MGLRFFLTILAVWLLFYLVRRALRQRRQQTAEKTTARPAVDMVRCSHCGTHLPQPEALQRKGRYYCCKEHLLADDRESKEP